MLIRFTKAKRSDKRDVLTCVRDEGSETWLHERPGFVLTNEPAVAETAGS